MSAEVYLSLSQEELSAERQRSADKAMAILVRSPRRSASVQDRKLEMMEAVVTRHALLAAVFAGIWPLHYKAAKPCRAPGGD